MSHDDKGKGARSKIHVPLSAPGFDSAGPHKSRMHTSSDESAIRQRLQSITVDYELSDVTIDRIVDAYFTASGYGVFERDERTELLAAQAQLKTARDSLAAFECAWIAATHNRYLLTHLFNEYRPDAWEGIARFSPAYYDTVRQIFDGVNSLRDLKPTKEALDAVAQRDSLTVPKAFTSQTQGRTRDAQLLHLIGALERIANDCNVLPHAPRDERTSFVYEVMKAFGFRQSRKTIRNLLASLRQR